MKISKRFNGYFDIYFFFCQVKIFKLKAYNLLNINKVGILRPSYRLGCLCSKMPVVYSLAGDSLQD